MARDYNELVRRYRSGIKGPAVLFVKADWCPHCVRAKPEVARAARVLGSVVPVYELDSERNKRKIESLGVDGFPTIFFLSKDGDLRTFGGERSGQKIADWACAQSGACGR